MTNNDKISAIINILSKTATEKEKADFSKWLNLSEENRKYYKQVEAVWTKLNKVYDNTSFDKSVAREKIMAKIQQKPRAKSYNYRFWLSAAASVLILVGAAFFIYLNSEISKKNLVSFHTSPDEIKEFNLPDSTVVWLNRNSTLVLAENFNKKQRKVYLQGEAFFDVAQNKEKEFKVLTGKTVTKVLGTSFHLALEENGKVKLGVKSGRVAFFRKYQMTKHMVLVPGENAAYQPKTNNIMHTHVPDNNVLSWKTGMLVFINTDIDEVCKMLSRHYNVPVRPTFKDENLSLTGTFYLEDLDDVLTTISLTLEINIEHKDREIILYK